MRSFRFPLMDGAVVCTSSPYAHLAASIICVALQDLATSAYAEVQMTDLCKQRETLYKAP